MSDAPFSLPTDYVCDVNNRPVKKVYDLDGAGAQGSQTTYYAYDGDQTALEFNGSDASNLKHRYLWGTRWTRSSPTRR